jgi:hypothetical protein
MGSPLCLFLLEIYRSRAAPVSPLAHTKAHKHGFSWLRRRAVSGRFERRISKSREAGLLPAIHVDARHEAG